MKATAALLGFVWATALACAATTAVAQQADQPSPADLAAAMEKAKRFTEPGEHHKLLERLVGKWDTRMQLVTPGAGPPPDFGTAETTWLIEGRWLQTRSKGTFLGMPMQSVTITGYDNFKMSYVATTVSNMDTAMNRTEGDLDQSGKTLIMYGTIDEYLTGEHDKVLKTVHRFLSDDKYVLEIHDLAIGEKNTKVIEITYTRQQ